jgi:hypothetical protein
VEIGQVGEQTHVFKDDLPEAVLESLMNGLQVRSTLGAGTHSSDSPAG